MVSIKILCRQGQGCKNGLTMNFNVTGYNYGERLLQYLCILYDMCDHTDIPI